jgi:type I restriction enzyme S subunit
MNDHRSIVRLSKICTKISDGTHHSPKVQLSEAGKGRFKYITSKNLRPWGLDITDIAYVTEDIHREIYDRCNPELGDVLLTKDGANTGMVAINTLEEEFSLLSSVALLKPDRSILEPRYLRYFLESPEGTKRIAGKMTGTAIRRIILKHIKDAEMPLVPLPEQKEIVAEIEKQFTRLDAGVAALRRVQANLKRYRASVLKTACEGRLVPTEAELARAEGRSYEPPDQLLARILTERRQKWSGRGGYEDQVAPDATRLPSLPKGWTWTTVEQVGSVRLGRQRSPKHHNGDFMRPYLRVANVYEDRIDLSDVKEMNFTPEEFETFALKPKDILLNEGQSLELVGRPAMYRGELPGACFTNTLVRFRPYDLLDADFALFTFRAFMHAGRFQKIAKWTTNIAHLGADRFAKMPFPLPGIKEQKRIVKELERQLSIINQLETAVTANLQRATRLRQSVLGNAFKSSTLP